MCWWIFYFICPTRAILVADSLSLTDNLANYSNPLVTESTLLFSALLTYDDPEGQRKEIVKNNPPADSKKNQVFTVELTKLSAPDPP